MSRSKTEMLHPHTTAKVLRFAKANITVVTDACWTLTIHYEQDLSVGGLNPSRFDDYARVGASW